jgi:hypothetical protein
MDDHFWPAVYPGLIVGVIIGLSLVYRLSSALLGAVGGLGGAFVAQLLVDKLGLEHDLLRLACLIGAAAAGAFAFAMIGQKLFRKASPG